MTTAIVYEDGVVTQIIRGQGDSYKATVEALPAGTVYMETDQIVTSAGDAPPYDPEKVTIA